MAQFLQDVQGYSPLRAGVAFVPMPAAVFVASQLTSRVLLRRLPEKAVMVMGSTVAIIGLALATQVGAHTPYSQIVVSLVLIGAGFGSTLVALTSASLADVEPEIAGAASGLVNVSQQLGAAVGLAVLVTVFNSVAGHAQLVPGHTTAASVHALRDVFYVTGVFALGRAGDGRLRCRPVCPGGSAGRGGDRPTRTTSSPSTSRRWPHRTRRASDFSTRQH